MRKEHDYPHYGMITEKDGVFVPFKYIIKTRVVMREGEHHYIDDGERQLVSASKEEFATLAEAEKALGTIASPE